MEPLVVSVPPSIVPMPWKNKTYAVSGGTWLEVPDGTTLATLPPYMVFKGYEIPEASPPKHWTVEGSKGKVYVVKVSNEGAWSCTCPGYSFRRRCKHVESMRLDYKVA